jgi:hypothetical protein
MQVALTIAVLLFATYYVVKRLFFKKGESCEGCEKH